MNGIRSFASDRLRIILFCPEGEAGYFFVIFLSSIPTDTKVRPNADLMLAHRLRRWANIRPALVQCLVCLLGMSDTWWLFPQTQDIDPML